MVLTRKRNRKYKVNLNETLQFPLCFFALIRKSDGIYTVNLSFSVLIRKQNRKYKVIKVNPAISSQYFLYVFF